MNTVCEFAAYFNPFGENPCSDRDALDEFYDLDTESKVYTVVLTALAFIGSIFVLGTAAVAVFRLCTHRWSVMPADSLDESPKSKAAGKTERVFDDIVRDAERPMEPDEETPKAKAPSKPEEVIDEIVVKESKKTNLPIGFINYGNSCWFASGLQVLLANKFFEEIVRAPIKTETVKNYKRGVPDFRPLTAEELQQRKNIQTALIQLIDRRKERNSEAIRKALIHLHETILLNNILPEKPFAPLLQKADSAQIIIWLSEIFGYSDCLFKNVDMRSFLNPSLKTPDEIETVLKGRFEKREMMPDLISFIDLPEIKVGCNLNAMIDLSRFARNGETAIYKIVGVAQAVPGHWYAFVRNQDQWYCCNDGQVMDQLNQTISIDGDNHVILERISS